MENRFTIKSNDKNYIIFGSEENLLEVRALKIPGSRYYGAGLIDKDTKEKKPAITIPPEQYEVFAKWASIEITPSVNIQKKPTKTQNLEDEPTEDRTTEEWEEAFTVPKKVPKRHEEIKFLKRFNSNQTFNLMNIVEIGNLRFQIYYSPHKTLIFFENFVAIVQYTNDFYDHEAIYRRDLKCNSREEFLQKYLIMLRNFDYQPYNYSQIDLGNEKAIYFFIKKYQTDVKKKFISQFLTGIDLYLFETNFLLSIQS